MRASRIRLCAALLLCGAATTLCACVAAIPLGQAAVSSVTAAALRPSQPCTQPNGCSTVMTGLSLQDMVRSFNTSVQKWTGAAPEGQDTPPPPGK